MKASEVNYLKFLQGTKQFVVPIYQRTYSWKKTQCNKLLKDIIRVGRNVDLPAHFIGSIVYIEKGIYQVTSVSQLLVIDGQQRLTTLSLLLSAIAESINENDDVAGFTKSKIKNYYILNNEEVGDLQYKLKLTDTDRDTHWRITKGLTQTDNASLRVDENYKFFINKIKDGSFSLEELIKGIQKLVIVDISLDRDHDNPQLIFESLNSTGLDLSHADLIRNYILMGLENEQQKYLYETYWHVMENDFGQANYAKYFDWFIRDYLTLKSKSGVIPTVSMIYEAFKTYAIQHKDTIEEIVKDIYKYSKHYTNLLMQTGDDPEIALILKDICILKVDVSYPFLMEILNDYENGILEKSELIQILKIVESYVFRRAVCGIPTNSMNKTFSTFTRSGINKDNYLECVIAKFLLLDSYRRFPRNDEFRESLLNKDVYNFRSRNYLLRKLENHDRKENVVVDDYTIEHIMPQNTNLSKKWRDELGEDWETVQSIYLHTIGNLTLTGYNSELSDRPFVEKQSMKGGFADSPIRLNRGLAKVSTWNKESILKRAKKLSLKISKIWTEPSIDPDILDRYRIIHDEPKANQYTIETFAHAEYMDGITLDLFNTLRNRILNLDTTVKEEFKKLYIAYKTSTNFIDIVPQKSKLLLILNMKFDEINDPNRICRNVANLGRWGNGDVEIKFENLDEINDRMHLIEQAFEKHNDDGA